MGNIIKLLESKNIIGSNNPIKNRALETLLDFKMPSTYEPIINNSLYYCSSDDIQLLIEISDKDVKEVDIINGNNKYTIITYENDLGINCDNCISQPFFTANFYSLKCDGVLDNYHFTDIITADKNIFDFYKKEKGKGVLSR